MAQPPILMPGNYVPPNAVAFGAIDGEAQLVDRDRPLPVAGTWGPATSSPLAGVLTQSGEAGPFVAELNRPIWITLSGDWSGSVSLLRSVDGGAVRLPLTIAGEAWGVFVANANEAVAIESENAASYYLTAALTAGSLTYRVAQ